MFCSNQIKQFFSRFNYVNVSSFSNIFEAQISLRILIAYNYFAFSFERNTFRIHHVYMLAFPFFRASFLTKTLHVDDHSFKFQIWDTAGQEKVSECEGDISFIFSNKRSVRFIMKR